ncbi:hypothetical protein JD844_019488 [Phrynosoma platyrhinos]|uniref:C2H2-type domain-containing protein n=1 Tax=Phrynosoma platyrhinos TaxID=52577 RepID=A0ABQ7TQK6_PHRPL|nr:hypothetical protein JD844_019488 [Phrynosoma platyrhinos]
MEAAMATGAGPAGLTAAGASDQEGSSEARTEHGNQAAAFLSLPAAFDGEDEDDRHKCGRCQSEFTSLEEFVQHKLQKLCQRQHIATVPATAVATPANSGHIKEIIVAGDHVFESSNGHIDGGVGEEEGSPGGPEEEGTGSLELIKVKLLASILKVHMITHSSRKDYECKLCGTSFRTKGSLIRHHRRHTDERPYKCKKCGKSFRESGALTRHLKSLTPCTEKIRFNMNKEIIVSKEELATELNSSGTEEAAPSLATPSVESSPVIHLVTDAKGNILHEVHVQMQELPISEAKALSQENLLREAMRNSGLVIERVSVEDRANSDEANGVSAGEEPKSEEVEAPRKLCGEQYVKVEQVETPEVEATDECKRHVCPYCSETFREHSSLDLHISGHLDYKPFTCEECGKEFTKGYLLKKHQEVHVNERRFRCEECGKLYKTIAHVKGHRRVHSDERPYPCPKCGKRYKTKNAQQVHFRTHLDEKPYVCQFCSQGFREKGSLVRHIRHHTGEKPFKCYKCGRGFAEHGTLNRHLRTKGGCLLALKEAEEAVVSEEGPSVDSLAATVISEDPPTVLVEFSSVVADTQEYIIETATEHMESSEAAEIIEGTRHEVDSHIMKVVQQIVNQASSGHQIIVQNVTVAESSAMASDSTDADTIAIATPESLTEQVAMTLASAIGKRAVLTTEGGCEAEEATVTMVASEDIEIMEHTGGEYVMASQEEELEIETVIV